MWFDGWEQEYAHLIEQLEASLPTSACRNLTFELIQHRFTKTAKRVIEQRYPNSKLVMEESERKYKWGRYGQGKYIYPDEQAQLLHHTLSAHIAHAFPEAKIEYFT
jgi:spore photoproduct lyase